MCSSDLCEVVVARSRSKRMIVGEDAVCWHSLSERLVLEGPDLLFVTYLQSCSIIIIIYDEL